MSELGFTPTSFHKLVGFILRELNREVGAVELAKIIYLTDVEAMELLGRSVSEDEYTRQKKGPLPMHFYPIIRDLDGAEIEIVIKPTIFRPKHCHRLGKELRFEFDLTPEQEAVARRVIDKVRDLRLSAIVKLAYETKPMIKLLKTEEASGRGKLLGEHVDLSEVDQNPRLARWRRNRAKQKSKPDPEYEAHRDEERNQAEEMFAA